MAQIASTPYPTIASIGSGIGQLICGHIDLVFRRIMSGEGVEFDPRFIRFLTLEPHPFGNFACLTHPMDVESASAAIDPLRTCPAPAAVLTIGPASAAVDVLVRDAGFERHGGMPAMAVEIDSMAATTLPSGYTFERVSDPAQRGEWSELFARGYELPARVGAAFDGGITGDDRPDAPIQYFWVRKNGVPVATSVVFLHQGVAGIYAVATLPEERGKGLGAHVTAEPLRIARSLGFRVGVLQASEAGTPVYERLGFGTYGEVPLYVRMPA